MATPKKLIKELILISGLRGLNFSDFIKRVLGLSNAAIKNPTIAPNLDPTPAVIKAKADAFNLLLSERIAIAIAYKAKTVCINTAKSELLRLINYSWAHQAQTAVAGKADLASKLGWFVKGIYTGEATVVVGMVNDSCPIINHVDNKVHLEHTVSIVNNLTGKPKLAKGAGRIEVYMQIGGDTAPNDISKMSHLGTATRGKYHKKFNVEDLYKPVYYMAVYINKKNQKTMTQSQVHKAIIT